MTRADGSVVDFGDVGAGGSSFWVPYVGNGTYTVTVSAYGTPPGSESAKVVARESSATGSNAPGPPGPGADAPGPAGRDLEPGDASEVPVPGPDPAPEPEEPSCEDEPAVPPAPPEPPAPEDPVAPGDGNGGQVTGLSAEATSALSDSAELPETVECPDVPAEAPVGG